MNCLVDEITHLAILLAGVSESDIDACIKWAFGTGEKNLAERIVFWNANHAEHFTIKQNESAARFNYKIGRAYVLESYLGSNVARSGELNRVFVESLNEEEKSSTEL